MRGILNKSGQICTAPPAPPLRATGQKASASRAGAGALLLHGSADSHNLFFASPWLQTNMNEISLRVRLSRDYLYRFYSAMMGATSMWVDAFLCWHCVSFVLNSCYHVLSLEHSCLQHYRRVAASWCRRALPRWCGSRRRLQRRRIRFALNSNRSKQH